MSMSVLFEQLDSQDTPMGELTLRRRRIPALGDKDIYEVKLGDDYLMSSMFVDAEVALADLALKEVQGENLSVVVGGLGLGYTAQAALADRRVNELLVVEALRPVIRWHEEGKVPVGVELSNDERCSFVHADFFEAATGAGFDSDRPELRLDAILLDIDHSPRALLSDKNSFFYAPQSLRLLSEKLQPNGIFAMWSNEPSDAVFLEHLNAVFQTAWHETVTFYNPLQNCEASNTIYLAKERTDGTR
jgi:spermidine synthase